jgi:hypothetical protein
MKTASVAGALATLGFMTLGLSGAAGEDNAPWASLFDGKDRTGWTARGRAAWWVQDGVLVGVGGMGHKAI